MNTVRKIHNLLSTGQVTVSTNNQRVLKQQQHHNSSIVHHGSSGSAGRCYVCDVEEGPVSFVKFHDLVTNHSAVKFPNKIGQVIGSSFMVIVSVDDLICQRCVNLVNNYDRFETEAEKYKSSLLTALNKKYDLSLENNNLSGVEATPSPPIKMQKLTPTNANIRRITMNDSTGSLSGDEGSPIMTRKVAISNDDENKQVTTSVRQINIATPKTPNQVVSTVTAKKQSGSIKIYKCVSCEYKTPDLKNFQTHYEDCRIKNAQCRICKKIFANANVMKQHMQEKHPNAQATTTTILYNCSQCQFQTTDKVSLEEHLKSHSKKVVKVKPFKCRLCSMRFESREQATIHAKSHQQAHQAQTQQQAQQTYFKCGACSATFPQKDLLVKHFETHRTPKQQPQTKVVQHVDKTKLLQDTIEEALRETKEEVVTTVSAADANKINFFSCNICSLTFLQETYYNSHMETHKQKSSSVVASASTKTPIVSSRISSQTTAADIKVDVPVSSDIESIFEKMHSDEGDAAGSASKTGEKNLVITTQENNNGITFNITIPTSTEDGGSVATTTTSTASKAGEKEKPQIGIDMPTLDLGEEQSSAAAGSTEDSEKKKEESKEEVKSEEKEDSVSGPPVSMPSLDDEGESTNPTANEENPASEETQQAGEEPMETDEKDGEPQSQEEVQQEEGETTQEEGVQHDGEEQQTEEGEQEQLTQMELDGIEGVEGGNIKFIINENGQLIQLDENHILTTDADGNQILVQGAAGDSEHIQQLLQSVGAFTEGDGSGQQMVLVQGEGDSEPQLIDASQLINADGHHIVIQQGDEVQLEEQEQDGETVAVSYADA